MICLMITSTIQLPSVVTSGASAKHKRTTTFQFSLWRICWQKTL